MFTRLNRWLFTFDGRIDRRGYVLTAMLLVTIKYAIDHTIAAHYGAPWPITVYVLPAREFNLFGIGSPHPRMFAVLWLVALPFFWTGMSLTLRRLRDAGLAAGWLLLFFVPVANLVLFLLLSSLPSQPVQAVPEDAEPPLNPNAPLLGFALAVVVGVVLAVFSAQYLAQYAWGLFLGVPFLIGFIAAWFLNARGLHTRTETTAVSTLAVLVVGMFLLGFRFEGLICLLMAVPLAVPLAIGGGMAARVCLESRARHLLQRSSGLSMCIAILPALMLVEHHANPEPPIRPVVTSIVITAPASVVWKDVVAFSPLGPPQEWLFHTGIAYPIGATISGTGPGAIRRCRFSTGDFVEPITTWDENHLLAFSVASQPPALTEIILGAGPIHTPHIERDYLRSRHGQFKLTALDANHTLLEGTTWYQDYFWPQFYWRPLSDAIIHRIHLRVLEHVKEDAEAGRR